MGFFDLFAGHNKNKKSIPSLPVEKCRTSLVKALCLATNSRNSFVKNYPELNSILARSERPHDDWCFFFIAGGIFTALSHPLCKGKLREDILNDAQQINAQMLDFIDDIYEFFSKKADETSDPKHIIGLWVLWNIGGGMPSLEECRALAPAIGSFLNKVISDCFQSK